MKPLGKDLPEILVHAAICALEFQISRHEKFIHLLLRERRKMKKEIEYRRANGIMYREVASSVKEE